jgi:hypothetical protein
MDYSALFTISIMHNSVPHQCAEKLKGYYTDGGSAMAQVV